MSAKIYYDGECPFCSRYVGLVHLRETVGQVDLINLREDANLREELTSEGYDLDQGMVVEVDGKRVGGADATHLMATLSTPSGLFNRLNRAVFSVPLLSALIYPLLRAGRWFTLFLLGRKTINDTDQASVARQKLFALLFALFSVFHVFTYVFEYGLATGSLDLAAIMLFALLLLLRPGSARLLFFLVLASTVSTIVQAPVQSNHTMLRSMFLIGYWLSFIYAMAKARPIGDIFANVVMAGRGALLVMYFFGIFHKINSEFLNPEYSCAAVLWDQMLPPLNAIQSVYLDYAGIYATFIVEGLLVFALLNPKTRHIGMIGGIGFHVFLSFSNYAAYLAFTTLTISMHVLYLSRDQLDRINTSQDMAWLQARISSWASKLAALMLLLTGAFFMLIDRYNVASLCMLPLVFMVCALIVRHGRAIPTDTSRHHSRAAYVIGTLVTALYFVNGAMPYVGLKTAQAVNMFSNLRVEAGVSNHLLLPNPPRLFGYLDDMVIVTAHGDDEGLRTIEDPKFGFIYYDLLGKLADNPDLRVSFERNGQSFANVGAADLQDDIDQMLHSPAVRKFFHFREVLLAQPPTCV